MLNGRRGLVELIGELVRTRRASKRRRSWSARPLWINFFSVSHPRSCIAVGWRACGAVHWQAGQAYRGGKDNDTDIRRYSSLAKRSAWDLGLTAGGERRSRRAGWSGFGLAGHGPQIGVFGWPVCALWAARPLCLGAAGDRPSRGHWHRLGGNGVAGQCTLVVVGCLVERLATAM